MSDPIRHLHVLRNNPFIFSTALRVFFESLGPKDRGLLAGYLVLPLVLYPQSRTYLLQRPDKRSCLRIMLRQRERIFGIGDKVTVHQQLTDTTIQYLVDSKTVSIDDRLAVRIVDGKTTEELSPDRISEAAERLGRYCRPFDVPTVFRLLGVMSL